MFDNLAEALSRNARRRPNHVTLIEGDRRYTCRALDRVVRSTAAHLAAMGVAEGDIVGIALKDGADHLILLYAVARLGAIILPMDVRWTVDEKARLTGFFEARVVVLNEGDAELPGNACAWVDGAWHEAVAALDGDRPFPGGPDLPLALSLSSGTTGIPKGPLITHSLMFHRFLINWMTLAFTETDRYLSAMPLYFGGSRAYAMSNLFCGATVVMLPPPYKPQDIVEAVRAHRITTSFLVPTMLRRLLEIAPADRPLLEGLRVLLCTGSVLHPDERREVLARISPALCNYYGSTEGGGATLLRPEVEGEAAASVGRAVLGVEVEVVGEDQRPLPAGEEGRIRYRGPSVPERGYKDTDGGERAFRDGWYYPGDLGRLDEAGYLYVTGRAKDMIIRGGANIYPVEIEQVLLANEAVRDAAVVGWPSQEYGEEIAAFVIKQADTDEAELIAYCRSRLAPYKLPRGIFFVDDFPKTGPGKIHKKKLAEGLPKL